MPSMRTVSCALRSYRAEVIQASMFTRGRRGGF